MEVTRWSPAREILDTALGPKPRVPDVVDFEYLRTVVNGYEVFSSSEAFSDFISAIEAKKKELYTDWQMGKQGSERNQKAAEVLHWITKLPMLAKARLEHMENEQRKLRKWETRGRATGSQKRSE